MVDKDEDDANARLLKMCDDQSRYSDIHRKIWKEFLRVCTGANGSSVDKEDERINHDK